MRLLTALSLLLERACLLVAGGEHSGVVRLDLMLQPAELLLRVEDNGPPPESLATHKLLQPFAAISGDSSAGIELSLVQSIVSDHRGVIEVGQSELGGCSICLRLPLLP